MYPLEIVSRYRDPQHQVDKHYLCLCNLYQNNYMSMIKIQWSFIFKILCLKNIIKKLNTASLTRLTLEGLSSYVPHWLHITAVLLQLLCLSWHQFIFPTARLGFSWSQTKSLLPREAKPCVWKIHQAYTAVHSPLQMASGISRCILGKSLNVRTENMLSSTVSLAIPLSSRMFRSEPTEMVTM